MSLPADRIRQSRALGAPSPQPAPPAPTTTKRPPALPPGTDAVALAELRNAAATYDFLRRRGDPAQFWETLRLARSRRAIVAPPEGEAPPPAPEMEALIVHEVDSIRRQFAALVRDLRRYLKPLRDLPEPADRLEMALAFLLASNREHQAVARWLAEPGKHEGKAAEKLRSLAAITDPYREALRPWSPAGPAPSIHPQNLQGLRRAIQCWEIVVAFYPETELWEMLLLVASEPEPTRAALEQLDRDAESGLLENLESGAESFRGKAAPLRAKHAGLVRSLRGKVGAPADPDAFEVALGLLLAAGEEDAGRLPHWTTEAERYLAALNATEA